MATVSYTAMNTPPPIPFDQAGYATISKFSAFMDNVSWQLYGGSQNDRAVELYAKEQYDKYYFYPDFDMRTYYDIDGYVLKGSATFSSDPAAGGYMYLCVQVPSAGWSCAKAEGAPT